jgi:vitamin B12 transporter
VGTLTLRAEAVVWSATLLYVGPWRDVSPLRHVTGLTANGYALGNLAASYDLGNRLSACGRIDNLFDRGYQNPIGF